MNPQILAAVITVGLTVLAAIIGYFFREFRNRAKPFLSITHVEGNLFTSSKRIDVPEPITQSLKDSIIITSLSSRDTLYEIKKASDDSREVTEQAPELLEMIQQFSESAGNNEFASAQSILGKILVRKTFERWIIYLFAQSMIIPPKVDKQLPKVIPVSESNEYEGCFLIAVPGMAFSFGKHLSKLTILKPHVEDLVALVERMDLKGLVTLFNQIESKIQSVLETAKDLKPLLNELLHEHSIWAIRIYVANLGRTPFIINQTGMIHVKDETGAEYHEECHLVNISLNDDGEIVRNKATTPLVVGSERDVTLEVITSKVQGAMNRGNAFREAFTSESAKCWAELLIEKVGIIRHKKLKTPKAAFKESV